MNEVNRMYVGRDMMVFLMIFKSEWKDSEFVFFYYFL